MFKFILQVFKKLAVQFLGKGSAITGSSDRVKCCVTSLYKPFKKQQILLDYLKIVLNKF